MTQVHQPSRRQPKPKARSLKTTLTPEQEEESLRRKKAKRSGHQTDARSGASTKVM